MASRDLYSLRIYAQQGLVSSAGMVGPIVPAGFVYVVRDIDVCWRAGPAGSQVVVYGQTGGIIYAQLNTQTVAAESHQWQGRQVYAVGERVGVQVFVGTWDVQISGYQLTTP